MVEQEEMRLGGGPRRRLNKLVTASSGNVDKIFAIRANKGGLPTLRRNNLFRYLHGRINWTRGAFLFCSIAVFFFAKRVAD